MTWLAVFLSVFCNSSIFAEHLRIDAAYPGGNVVVAQIAEDTVTVRPDLHDTGMWWFYWNFRVRGAAGRQIEFLFDGKNPIGARGPAVSTDQGISWSWLGMDTVRDQPIDASFRFDFPTDADEVRFAFAIPYQNADLQKFISPYVRRGQLQVEELCRTPQDKPVELLRISPSEGQTRARVLLTARHHACETMASYTLEGLLAAVLEDDDTGRWLRERIEFLAVPFMDIDGVEAGDQGKNRVPHDHWLDYQGESRYASVRALREYVDRESEASLRMAIDLHCPFLRETSDAAGSSERVFFMNSMAPAVEAETKRFQTVLARELRGPIPYSLRHDLALGMRFNTLEIATPSFLGWASQLPGIWVATVLEVPYANADGVEVNPDSARALGRDLAVAMRGYFDNKFSR